MCTTARQELGLAGWGGMPSVAAAGIAAVAEAVVVVGAAVATSGSPGVRRRSRGPRSERRWPVPHGVAPANAQLGDRLAPPPGGPGPEPRRARRGGWAPPPTAKTMPPGRCRADLAGAPEEVHPVLGGRCRQHDDREVPQVDAIGAHSEPAQRPPPSAPPSRLAGWARAVMARPVATDSSTIPPR